MRLSVPLDHIVPSRFRDLEADPLDATALAAIGDSIHDTGLWDVLLPGRRVGGARIEIAHGHHLVEAARRAGVASIDVDVADRSDEEMVRLLVAENAARRSDANMVVEAVAAVTKLLLTAIVAGDKVLVPNVAKLQGQVVGWQGLGTKAVLAFVSTYLHDLPGLNPNSVRFAMAKLKRSGRYTNIAKQVLAEVTTDKKAKEADRRIRQQRATKVVLAAERFTGPDLVAATKLGGRPVVDTEAQKARRALLADALKLDATLTTYLRHTPRLDAEAMAAMQPIIDKVRAASITDKKQVANLPPAFEANGHAVLQ